MAVVIVAVVGIKTFTVPVTRGPEIAWRGWGTGKVGGTDDGRDEDDTDEDEDEVDDEQDDEDAADELFWLTTLLSENPRWRSSSRGVSNCSTNNLTLRSASISPSAVLQATWAMVCGVVGRLCRGGGEGEPADSEVDPITN